MNILTEGRCYDLIGLLIIGKLNLCQESKHFFRSKAGSQKCIDLLRFKRYSGRLADFIADIHHSADNLSCTQFLHELAGSVNGCLRIVRIQSLLEFTGSICTEANPLGRKTDIGAVKASCLKENCFHLICDHRILSAHDSRNSYRFFTVTDHQHLIIHGTFLSIQSNEFFIFFCTAYNDLSAFNGIQIIGMHWLAKFFHHIIGDINQVVDRTDSVGSQTSLHPFWGRSDLYIFYNSCTVTWAKLRILHCNLYIIRCLFFIALTFYNRRTEFLVKGSCCLSGNSQNSIAVHTVGCDLIFKDNIIQSKCLYCAFSYYCILWKNINSILRCIRVHLFGTSQFFNRTHHTIRIHTAEFTLFDLDSSRSFLAVMSACYPSAVQNNRNLISFFYIWGTGYDLNCLCPYIYLADDQLICIRMFFNFFNLANDDFVQVCIQLFKALYLCTCQGHGICIFLCCHIKIRHIHFNPR